jgi:septal ring-binding cell division protein DamX
MVQDSGESAGGACGSVFIAGLSTQSATVVTALSSGEGDGAAVAGTVSAADLTDVVDGVALPGLTESAAGAAATPGWELTDADDEARGVALDTVAEVCDDATVMGPPTPDTGWLCPVGGRVELRSGFGCPGCFFVAPLVEPDVLGAVGSEVPASAAASPAGGFVADPVEPVAEAAGAAAATPCPVATAAPRPSATASPASFGGWVSEVIRGPPRSSTIWGIISGDLINVNLQLCACSHRGRITILTSNDLDTMCVAWHLAGGS